MACGSIAGPAPRYGLLVCCDAGYFGAVEPIWYGPHSQRAVRLPCSLELRRRGLLSDAHLLVLPARMPKMLRSRVVKRK